MTEYEDILNMTNQEAANVLKNILLSNGRMARGNGKSTMALIHTQALFKAIALLEKTPDEKAE